MKIGIVIATYRKLDGSTYSHLLRALQSIKDQTHQDYKVFLIGDDYDDNDELMKLSGIIDGDKIYVENLPIAVERIKYEGHNLWVCGGVNAMNVGIQRALDNGYNYLCILDHDDYYFPNHLEVLSEAIKTTGTHFLSTKCGNLPGIQTSDLYTPYRPVPQLIYKTSACIDFSHYDIRFVNMIDAHNYAYPSDANLWARLDIIMTQKKEYGILINVVTCDHPSERNTIYSPHAVKKSISPTQYSLNLVKSISQTVNTFHHHYHIIYDIASSYEGEITYLEIGCYYGGSSCLMLQRPLTNVIAIDLGSPILMETVLTNVKRLNIHSNSFRYIQGNSHDKNTIDKLGDTPIDILFIDGGHSYDDVIKDFTLYEPLIRKNGYIIFDDYNDNAYSPEVKTAVDYLQSTSFADYAVIGTFKNILQAHPKEMTEGNCFVIQKKIIH